MGATPGAATGRQGRAMELPETVMELPETVMGLPETVTELRGRAMVHRETATGLQETVLRLQGRAEEGGRAGVPGRARGAQGKGGGRGRLPGDRTRDPAAGGRGPTPGVAGPHLPGPPRGTGAGVQWHGGPPLLLLTPVSQGPGREAPHPSGGRAGEAEGDTGPPGGTGGTMGPPGATLAPLGGTGRGGPTLHLAGQEVIARFPVNCSATMKS